jgi:hypothetical protein
MVRAVHRDQRPKKRIPLPGEGKQRQQPQRGQRQRQEYREQDAQMRSTVDTRSILEFLWDGQKRLTQQKTVERAECHWYD